jgi:hypothetical protein
MVSLHALSARLDELLYLEEEERCERPQESAPDSPPKFEDDAD